MQRRWTWSLVCGLRARHRLLGLHRRCRCTGRWGRLFGLSAFDGSSTSTSTSTSSGAAAEVDPRRPENWVLLFVLGRMWGRDMYMGPAIAWLPQQLWPSWLSLSRFLVPAPAPSSSSASSSHATYPLSAAAATSAALPLSALPQPKLVRQQREQRLGL